MPPASAQPLIGKIQIHCPANTKVPLKNKTKKSKKKNTPHISLAPVETKQFALDGLLIFLKIYSNSRKVLPDQLVELLAPVCYSALARRRRSSEQKVISAEKKYLKNFKQKSPNPILNTPTPPTRQTPE